jgi:hypothetical protein
MAPEGGPVTRARSPLCLLLALSVVVPLYACGRYSNVPPPPASRAAPSGESAEHAPAPTRTPASSTELARYAEREKQSRGLERFEGGRMSDATLIVVLLLFVIIIILIT